MTTEDELTEFDREWKARGAKLLHGSIIVTALGMNTQDFRKRAYRLMGIDVSEAAKARRAAAE